MGNAHCRIGAVVVCVVLAGSMVAFGPSAAFALTTSPITKLPSSSTYKEAFSSDGTRIVYDVLKHETDVYGRIGIYHAASRTESIVSSDARNPDVSGNTIVYEVNRTDPDTGGSDGSIYAYNLATKTESAIAAAETGQFVQPRTDGRSVVFSGFAWNGAEIGVQGVDLSTGATFTVSDDPNAYAPDISNGWVVYCVLRPSTVFPSSYSDALQGDIMAYNIETKTTYTLCDDIHDQRSPRIGSDGTVVWEDDRNAPSYLGEANHSNTDVYGCSVYDHTVFAAAKLPGHQAMASVEGSVVVYYDSTFPGGYGVMGYDRLSGTRFGLAPKSNKGVISGSGLSDGMIVWGQTRSVASNRRVSDLYMMQPARLEVAEDSDVYTNAAVSSKEAFPGGADAVVIANGESWSDELAGASLLGANTPLLLVEPDTLPEVTASELRRLGATTATILGSSSEVSTGVAAAVEAILAENRAGLSVLSAVSADSGVLALASTGSGAAAASANVVRIGGSRYVVADSVAHSVAARKGWDGTVVVVSGVSFSDAMAVIPVVYAKHLPVILSARAGLSASQISLLKHMHAKRITIVGGTKAVPSKVGSQASRIVGARNVRRLAGKDVYATAALVAAYSVDTYHMKWNGVGITSGASFTSALTGGLRGGRRGSVVLLTAKTGLSSSTAAILTSHRAAIRKARYLGAGEVARFTRGQVRLILR